MLRYDPRRYKRNLSICKREAWKNPAFNGILIRYFCYNGALLYRLSYEATAVETFPAHWIVRACTEFIFVGPYLDRLFHKRQAS